MVGIGRDYRVGLSLESDGIVFERVLHRKEIYRYSPDLASRLFRQQQRDAHNAQSRLFQNEIVFAWHFHEHLLE